MQPGTPNTVGKLQIDGKSQAGRTVGKFREGRICREEFVLQFQPHLAETNTYENSQSTAYASYFNMNRESKPRCLPCMLRLIELRDVGKCYRILPFVEEKTQLSAIRPHCMHGQ